MSRYRFTTNPRFRIVALLAALALTAAACGDDDGDTASPSSGNGTDETTDTTDGAEQEEDAEPPGGPYEQSPWWPWLSAHIDAEPEPVRGGPITVQASQDAGTSVNWVLPGPRELDPAVFGTADAPKGTESPAGLLGVPVAGRATDGDVQRTAEPTPFGDEAAPVEGGFELRAVDATATDASSTEDELDFEATFTGPDGADYEVRVEDTVPHGWAFPTGGGVVTNFIQHGVTGWGTRLMPTEWSDLSWYGVGDVLRDGEVIAEDRPMHGMLTEFVRGEGYSLVDDAGVNPAGRHFHLMVFPFDAFGNPDPVPTGFELPNGAEQPFLHIMYPLVDVEAEQPEFPGELPEGFAAAGAVDPPPVPDEGPFRSSPWWPWLSAHVDADPQPLLAGPTVYQARQDGGSVNWVLPGKRTLDPTVFGTAEAPKGTETPAGLLGMPPPGRESSDGGQRSAQPTPFGDEFAAVEGTLDMTALDATATDAATTDDRLLLEATFDAPDGSQYRVVADRVAPHGFALPTGGGVVSNFIQHGVTGWGTRLMPTEYSELSWYAVGDVYRDGELVAENRAMHGMLTEFVRGEGYSLVDDAGVDPNGRHFHLMVFPFDPLGNPDPVPTGFMLPNGQQQPFLHIMYPLVEIEAGSLPGS